MDTYGWDTVYAISTEKVNIALAENLQQLITTFDQPDAEGFPVSAKGTFSKWEVVEGGSGQIIYLKLTVAEGTCTVKLSETKVIDIAAASMVVAVKLNLIPGLDSNLQELKMDIQRVGEIGSPPELGMITPVVLHDPSGNLDDAEKALLMVALAQYIVDNAIKITYAFATVNLVPPTSDSWLTPVKSNYVYANRIGNQGVLGILSVVTDRDISNLPHRIDETLLTSQYHAAFGISDELFLKYVIMPSLPQVFKHNTSPSTFSYNAVDRSIFNTAPIPVDSVKEGAITYYPRITSLRMRTNGSGLENNFAGDCDLKAGIDMKYWVDTDNQATFDPVSKGIGFLPDPDPSSRDESDIPWYFFFLGPIVILIVELVVKIIKDGIAGTLSHEIGEKVSLTKNPPTSIQWTDTSKLDVQFAAVNKGFYMEGNL